MSDEKEKDCSPAEEMLYEAELARDNGQSVPKNSRHLIHCLSVIGQIEGHYVLAEQNKTTKYEHIIPALVAIEQDRSVEGLLIILNTAGGDVEAGLALAEIIAGMKTPTVSLVVGGGHSIGVPLAVSAKRSFIVPSASMTVHPVRMNGMMLGVPQSLHYIDRMQDRIIAFVTRCGVRGRIHGQTAVLPRINITIVKPGCSLIRIEAGCFRGNFLSLLH